MVLPLLHLPQTPTFISLESFTPHAFSLFGTAITFPLSSSIQALPTASIPLVCNYPALQPTYQIANQSTALKFPDISPLINNYHLAPSSEFSPVENSNGTSGRPVISMFSCFPRQSRSHSHHFSFDQKPMTTFTIKILERHPYTSQTFSPTNLPPEDKNTVYLVIVAPTLHTQCYPARNDGGIDTKIRNPPDLTKIRAFVARGGQAVTYAPGTWHAPMAVLGNRRVDFVVTQFVSGVPEEDCQEVEIEGDGLVVDVSALLEEMQHGVTAKL